MSQTIWREITAAQLSLGYWEHNGVTMVRKEYYIIQRTLQGTYIIVDPRSDIK